MTDRNLRPATLVVGLVLSLAAACKASDSGKSSSKGGATATATTTATGSDGTKATTPCAASAATGTGSGSDTSTDGTSSGSGTDVAAPSPADAGATSSAFRLADTADAVPPAIAAKCATAGCHASGASAPDLSTAAKIKAQSAAIVASLAPGAKLMPPTGSAALSDSEKTAIKSWSAADAAVASPNPAVTSAPCDATGTASGTAVTGTGSGTDPGGVTDVATETTATDTSTTVAATTGALESCNAKGTSYVAVTTGGGAGVCSDPLAAYCCTETEVLRQFPSLAAKLKTQIDTFLGQGLKLYNCSLSSAGKTTLHFAAASSGGVQYHNLFFTGVSASGGASTGACAKVGSAELGLTQTDAVDDSGAVATSGTVPAVIGPDRTLANTSPSNLLAELNLERYTNSGYRTWTVKDHLGYIQGLQIYAKVYWNSSLAADLATSPPPASHRLGSISVMEAFADAAETQFQGWYVLGKASAANPDGWFTYQMTGGASAVAGGTPSFPAAPQTYEMGAAACSACHKTPAYPSYIIGP